MLNHGRPSPIKGPILHISFSQVLNVELLSLLGGGEEGDVNSPQELTEDGGQLLNMVLIMMTKCAIVLDKLPDIGHKHLHELDELLSDETNVLFKSKYDGVNQQVISKYRATFRSSFLFYFLKFNAALKDRIN